MIKSTNVIQLHDLLILTINFFYIIEQKLTSQRKKNGSTFSIEYILCMSLSDYTILSLDPLKI